MTPYITIAHDGEYEFSEKKSRFICQMARVKSDEAAQTFITEIKKKQYKATHNVAAYVLGEHDEIQRAFDDGEPTGTAGVPMLQVIQQMHLKDVVAVTTRYFGGTKLGAGGLIRAYANSVSEAAHHIGLVERRLQKNVSLHITYAQLGTVQNFLEQANQPIAETTYTDVVTVQLFIDANRVAILETELTDRLNGQVHIEIGQDSYREVPLDTKSESL
ncbi:YigZ family protein [Lacticaseibacillus brantae]|uniref:YigZ family protein n=1 Tax=Lacticaseibacillus brantae DSM 23927 TaxID=1423727 RepID=A0A0R2B303_9LACO|nr:YigZ family protein [Lacticaseibacillus brantae]KRM72340.1 hypothetical protein FC34_GL000040 [Lacticaseibacillus brantae DSM 23927]